MGGGTARVDFGRSAAFGLHASRVVYEFEDPAAVPEPASLLLLGSGLAGAVVSRRRKRQAA